MTSLLITIDGSTPIVLPEDFIRIDVNPTGLPTELDNIDSNYGTDKLRALSIKFVSSLVWAEMVWRQNKLNESLLCQAHRVVRYAVLDVPNFAAPVFHTELIKHGIGVAYLVEPKVARLYDRTKELYLYSPNPFQP